MQLERAILVFLLFFVFVSGIGSQDVDSTSTEDEEAKTKLAEGEQKMSDLILEILEHFKQPNPVGIPGVEVPEPYSVPDMKQSLSIGTMNLKNTAVYGLKKFRILYIDAEIGSLEVNAAMIIDKLQARGNYTLWTWFQKAQGPYTIDVTGLKVTARGTLGIERDGKLRVQDIVIDLGFNTLAVNFENLGFFASMFQGVVNSVGNFVFDSIKPYILKEAHSKARIAMNQKLEEFAGDIQFPNSISPLDMVISDARKIVRQRKYDPYKIQDYNKTVSVFSVSLTNTWLTGISSFQRVGNITLKLENNTVIADFDIGTQKLEGVTQWDITAVGGLASRAGTASFSVEYISGRFIIAQSLDTRQRPKVRDIELEVGNIQVRCNGAGTLDYLIEFVVNILPNLLRYQIMDALETPAMETLQQLLDKQNVEEYIKQKLPEIDRMQDTGLKLSDVINTESAEEPYDEDNFFNF